MVKVLPLFGSDATDMVPPSRHTSARHTPAQCLVGLVLGSGAAEQSKMRW